MKRSRITGESDVFPMSYRQWLIGMALCGACCDPNQETGRLQAKWAIGAADAVLEALGEEAGDE